MPRTGKLEAGPKSRDGVKPWTLAAGFLIVGLLSGLFVGWLAFGSASVVAGEEAAPASTAGSARGTKNKKAKAVARNGTTIPYPRPPDTRPNKCAAKVDKYDVGDSQVSIVIPYLREKYEYIEGTVGSILDNSPLELIKEILFISDGNTDAEGFHAEIEALSPLIRLIRLPQREGLIYAKTRGAREALGDIVLFFEPHCIVGRDWLQPLVHIVRRKPNSLVLPTLDYIPQSDFTQFGRAMMGRYRFEWNFNLIYTNPPTEVDENTSKPFFAPATSGGIFAIRKERFEELNLFDVGMKQWGGDQIELSFKAWRCGGSILVVPCSRVGHLFRDVQHRPYPVDVATVVENYAKLARVWLEAPYLERFYKVKPESRGMARGEDLSIPRSTFARLKCKSMDWYVQHVDLELGWEASRLCIPAAKGTPMGCELEVAKGRSTIDRTMPADVYREAAKKSDFFGKAKK